MQRSSNSALHYLHPAGKDEECSALPGYPEGLCFLLLLTVTSNGWRSLLYSSVYDGQSVFTISINSYFNQSVYREATEVSSHLVLRCLTSTDARSQTAQLQFDVVRGAIAYSEILELGMTAINHHNCSIRGRQTVR